MLSATLTLTVQGLFDPSQTNFGHVSNFNSMVLKSEELKSGLCNEKVNENLVYTRVAYLVD